jgi:(p)ppGpp synthase/HD superfamily hydrolase
MDLTTAILLATKMHHGQFDKGGHPYILHPLRLMLKADNDIERIVSVLHDVIEDTDCTKETLIKNGFSSLIIDAVMALTRAEGEVYADFIDRIGKNDIARKVKILDIEDNMDLTRITNPTEQDFSRLKRYKKSLDALNSIDKN